MTSTITNYSTLIDTSFPIAGQDNDTSGFRNNSIATVNALTVASTEISALQSTSSSMVSTINGISNTIGYIGTATTSSFVYTVSTLLAQYSANEVPSGSVNGSNETFELLHAPINNSLQLFANNSYQMLYANYTLSGNTITFLYSPTTGTDIVAFYWYASL